LQAALRLPEAHLAATPHRYTYRHEAARALAALPPPPLLLLLLLRCRHYLLFLDAGFFTGELAQVEYARAAHLTGLCKLYLLNKRRVDRKNTLHAYALRYLAYGKRLRVTPTSPLDNHALEFLQALLSFFHNAVGNRNRIAAFKCGVSLVIGVERCLRRLHQIRFHSKNIFYKRNVTPSIRSPGKRLPKRTAKVSNKMGFAKRFAFFLSKKVPKS
jgi:hypothetical protein